MHQRPGASCSFPCFGEPQHSRSTSAMALSAHQVVTAFEQGWSTLRNAEPQKKPSKYTQSHLPPLIQSD